MCEDVRKRGEGINWAHSFTDNTWRILLTHFKNYGIRTHYWHYNYFWHYNENTLSIKNEIIYLHFFQKMSSRALKGLIAIGAHWHGPSKLGVPGRIYGLPLMGPLFVWVVGSWSHHRGWRTSSPIPSTITLFGKPHKIRAQHYVGCKCKLTFTRSREFDPH